MVTALALGAFKNEAHAGDHDGYSHPHYTIKIVSAQDNTGTRGRKIDVMSDSQVIYQSPNPDENKDIRMTLGSSTEDPCSNLTYPYETLVQNQATSSGWNINVTCRAGFWEVTGLGETGVDALGYATGTVSFGINLTHVHRKETTTWTSHGGDTPIAERTTTGPILAPSWGTEHSPKVPLFGKEVTMVLACEIIPNGDTTTFKITGTVSCVKSFMRDGFTVSFVRNEVEIPPSTFSFTVVEEGIYLQDCGVTE